MMLRGDWAIPRELAEALKPFVDAARRIRRGDIDGAFERPITVADWLALLACFEDVTVGAGYGPEP